MLKKVDGVMLGREAYQNPYILHGVDHLVFGEKPKDKSRVEYLQEYFPYIEEELKNGTPLKHITRHLLGLFKGQKGGKQYRRYLSENVHHQNAGLNVLKDAIAFVA